MKRYARSMKVTSSLQSIHPITDDPIMKYAPSILAADKHESRSKGYTYVPTIQVIDRLRKEGFQPFYVAQSGTRDETRTDFTRHIVRLRHADHIGKTDVNEVVLLNSHDGTSSYQMMAGVLNFVCANGLFIGDLVSNIRVPHRGNIVEGVIEGSYTILQEFEKVDQSKDEMKSITLSDYERRAFANSAMALRYDQGDEPFEPSLLLSTRRMAQREPSLWNTFNVVQESLIRGGVPAKTKAGKRTTTRAMNNIPEATKLNQALWMLAESMTGLKHKQLEAA
ncbi:DUF932 domain-containing protein [Methylovulum miyakonense]|uniref:DUF932 domain-containing protein n=1 Tax=Methylovulum miyakonense TaxID=645578 RepID=UPI0004912B14|nr:DUF932 domain-containing protein [Methylovulum miyakonense]